MKSKKTLVRRNRLDHLLKNPKPIDPLLKKLMEYYGISGSEDEIRHIIVNEVEKYVDEVKVDKLGNVVAHKKGKKPRVMLAAHMDEVGLIVKSIDEKGRIEISEVGGIEPLSIIGQRVHIKIGLKRGQRIHGVVTTPEIIDGQYVDKLPRFEDLFVDTGLSKEQITKLGIRVGTLMLLEQETKTLGNTDLIFGKAVDDRLGCYILLKLAKLMKNSKYDTYFVFTVQEEVGLYGAKTSAYEISPDWAIAVDVINTDEGSGARLVGNGPCVTVKDAAFLGNRCLNSQLEHISKKHKIPVQWDVSDNGTTDALSISLAKGGVPATVVGLAVKNIHSTVGIASMKDVDNAVRLLNELLKNPQLVCFEWH